MCEFLHKKNNSNNKNTISGIYVDALNNAHVWRLDIAMSYCNIANNKNLSDHDVEIFLRTRPENLIIDTWNFETNNPIIVKCNIKNYIEFYDFNNLDFLKEYRYKLINY